jgi:hypothetical protein
MVKPFLFSDKSCFQKENSIVLSLKARLFLTKPMSFLFSGIYAEYTRRNCLHILWRRRCVCEHGVLSPRWKKSKKFLSNILGRLTEIRKRWMQTGKTWGIPPR